jgi:hypothetical protein
VFDPLAIALVIAANFAFNQLRPKKEYLVEEQVEDNEGSDIYTKEDFSDWDSTLMDGLEEEQPKGVPVYFDPESGRPYIIEETEDKEEIKDENLNNSPINNQNPNQIGEDKILNSSGISAWRKKKLRDYLDGNVKNYF